MKEYQSIIKLDSKEELLNYRQNCTIRRLNKYKNFLDTVTNLCIIKSVIKFKINFLNMTDKHRTFKYLSLKFFKDFAGTIKGVCKENRNEFKQIAQLLCFQLFLFYLYQYMSKFLLLPLFKPLTSTRQKLLIKFCSIFLSGIICSIVM